MGGGGETGVVGSAVTGAIKNQKAPPRMPRQLRNRTMLTTTIAMIATTDMRPALPEAGPAVAVPGCRLIPQCGQTRSLVWSSFEQDGHVFMEGLPFVAHGGILALAGRLRKGAPAL